jgi:hypothetical protein
MKFDFLYERNVHPFGISLEKWAARWCKWMLSIPKKKNPSIDETGKYCSMNQNDKNVWFLTGHLEILFQSNANVQQMYNTCRKSYFLSNT